MAECGALIKLLVVLCMSFNCLMRPVTSAIDQLPNLETIGIRATKISTAEGFIPHSEQLAVFPQLRFSCPTTLYKLWYIGQNNGSITDTDAESNVDASAPEVLILSMSSSGLNAIDTYMVRHSIELSTAQLNMQAELIESNVNITVGNNNIIGIRYPVDNGNHLRSDLLYEPGVEAVQSYFINDGLDEIDLNQHTTVDDYPLIAVETEHPECVSGFLSVLILESLLTTLEPFPLSTRLPLLRFECAGTVTNLLVGGIYTERQEDAEPLQICLRSATSGGGNAIQCDTPTALAQKSSNVFSLVAISENHIEVNSGDTLGLEATSQFSLYGQRSMQCDADIIFSSFSLCPLVAFDIEYHTSRSCVNNFEEDKAKLEQRVLLIDSITFITQRPTAQPQITTDESSKINSPTDFSIDRKFTDPPQQFADSIGDALATAMPPNTEQLAPTSEHDYVCIFPELRFENNGTISSWTFAALQNNPLSTTQQYPEIQIWRVDGEKYRRVSSINGQKTHIILGFLNVYKVEMKSPLNYKNGDVIGIYQPRPQVGALSVAFVENTQVTTLLFQADSNTQQLETTNNHETLTLQPLVTLETAPETLATTNLPATTAIISTKDEGEPLTILQSSTPTTQDGEHFKTTLITDSVTTIIVPGVTVPQSVDIVTIAAAGVGGLIAVILFLIVIFVIVIVAIKRKRKKLNGALQDRSANKDEAFDNPVYTEVDQHTNEEAQLYETPISLRSSQPQTIPINHEEPQPYETPTSSFANTRTHPNKGEPFYHILEQNNMSSQRPAAAEYFELELVVPTREQRNSLQQSVVEKNPQEVYVTLKKAQNISHSPTGSFFIESEMFWKPATNQEHLYQQLANNKYREIPRHHVQITGHLGGGQFGTVNKGIWQQTPVKSLDVAIKTLQPETEEKYKIHFLQEAAINGQFRHPNIVTLYGVVTIGEPVMIILELLANGDLRSYLNKQNPTPGQIVLSPGWSQTFLEFCQQIAAGMDYLSKKGFVHRDLAARNILVAANKTCKITDFGMSRDLDLGSYYISSGGVVPVKWTAPEAIQYSKYSKSSDVWSFGAVMYEIWSFGQKPFEKCSNQKALELVNEGYRLPPPPGCPKEIYRIMLQCWHPEPSLRPSFAALLEILLEPESELLHWSPEDLSNDMAAVLGAPLETGERLYHELQNTYMCAYESAEN